MIELIVAKCLIFTISGKHVQDPELDFDCVEMPIGNYEFNRYYRIKNGKVYQ